MRAGQFFLGTSRENTGPLWTSPYTISDSALNTWIAEEVRPIGVKAEWRLLTSNAAFRGNDSMGALLAWRGWTIGNRLTVYDEVLPLPADEAGVARVLDGRSYTLEVSYSIK